MSEICANMSQQLASVLVRLAEAWTDLLESIPELQLERTSSRRSLIWSSDLLQLAVAGLWSSSSPKHAQVTRTCNSAVANPFDSSSIMYNVIDRHM